MDPKVQQPVQAVQAQAVPAQAAAPQVAPQPAANPSVVTDQKSSGGSKKKFIIIVVAIVLILILGAVAFWFRQTQMSTQKDSELEVKAVEELTKEAESLKLDDLEKDFTEVDTDLQAL